MSISPLLPAFPPPGWLTDCQWCHIYAWLHTFIVEAFTMSEIVYAIVGEVGIYLHRRVSAAGVIYIRQKSWGGGRKKERGNILLCWLRGPVRFLIGMFDLSPFEILKNRTRPRRL